MNSSIDEIAWGNIFTVKAPFPQGWTVFWKESGSKILEGLGLSGSDTLVMGVRPASCGSWLIFELNEPLTDQQIGDLGAMVGDGEDDEEYEVMFGKATPEWVSNLPEFDGW